MTEFWQDPSLEPKRAFKFVLSIAGTGAQIPGSSDKAKGIPQFLIKKVSKPSFTISESEHKYLNHSFWFPGKVTWNEVSFTIVDVLGPDDGTAALINLLQAMGYTLPQNPGSSSPTKLSTISKKRAKEAIGQVLIKQIDSVGKTREVWTLNNAWIKDAKFGDLDYDSEDMLNVEVALRYDNASLKSTRTGEYSEPADILKLV